MKTQDIRNMGLAYVQVLEARKVNKHGHDHVGKEDDDVNNDKKVDGTDKYLLNRRKAISANIKKEDVQVDEALVGNQHKIDANKNGKVDAHDFKLLRSKKTQSEEVEGLDEGRPSQAHPLAGHDYHKKSNDQLKYIRKDAHSAAEAMKDHNTTAENKYRDQASDANTVLHFRKTSGTPDWYKKKYGHMKNESVSLGEASHDDPSHSKNPFKYTKKPTNKKQAQGNVNYWHYVGMASNKEIEDMGKNPANYKTYAKSMMQDAQRELKKMNESFNLDEISRDLATRSANAFADKADAAHDKKDYAGFRKGEAARKMAIAKVQGRAKVSAVARRVEEVELFDEEADLTKINTKTLQSMVQLHKHFGQKDPRSKAAAERGEQELKNRGARDLYKMKKEEVEPLDEATKSKNMIHIGHGNDMDEAKEVTKKTITSKQIKNALASAKARAKPKGEVSLAKAPWKESSEWPIFSRINEKLKLPSYKVSGIGDDPHEVTVKYATDDKHTKGATEPEKIDSKASKGEKDYIAKHGGLDGNESGIDVNKYIAKNSVAHTSGVKVASGRPGDSKIGDKNIIKSKS